MKTYIDQLKTELEVAMIAHHQKPTDQLVDKIRDLEDKLASTALVEKVSQGSTLAVIEMAKYRRIKHKNPIKAKNLTLEDLDLIKKRREVLGDTYDYKTSEQILKAVGRGEISTGTAKELLELKNLALSDEIIQRLAQLENTLNT